MSYRDWRASWATTRPPPEDLTDPFLSTDPLDQLAVGRSGAGPYAVTTGPDGALWVTLVHAGQIARVTVAGSVALHQLDSPTCQPSQITTGSDGALWFTRMGDDSIGRITPDGQVSLLPGDAWQRSLRHHDRPGRCHLVHGTER